MKKTLLHPFVVLMLVAFAFLGCSSKFSGFDQAPSGLYYKLFTSGNDTVKAKTGDIITLNMKYTTENDSVLFDSQQGMQGQPLRFQLPPSDFPGDLYAGIRMLAPGDSGVFKINADSLFTVTFKMPKRPVFIDTNSYITFYIKLLSAESVEELAQKEDEVLEAFLTENEIVAEPLESGLIFIEETAGKGKKIDTGDVVELHFSLKLADGKPVFSSYDRGKPIQMNFGKPFDNQGFDEAIGYMREGGKALVIVPSAIAFGATGRGAMVPPYSTLVYEVEIVSVMSQAEFQKQKEMEQQKREANNKQAKMEEGAKLKKYLKENNITTEPTASGLYYIEKEKGTGAKAETGKKVTVHYTGKLLDGTKFDSSLDRDQPFSFVLGQGQVIQGWDEGIGLMNVGGKATLIIPSSIAYKDRDMGVIPPYSTLVFDVELLNVE